MIFNFLLLAFAMMIWGLGFIATRWALTGLDPYWTIALRFLLAGSLGLPFLIYKRTFFKKENYIKESIISSSFLFLNMIFQTIGLTQTTVAKSGFITTLYIFFIPLISMFIYKRRYRMQFWGLVFLSLIGMGFLCNLRIDDLVFGDFLTLICSIFAAIHIMYIGEMTKKIKSAIEFNFLQNLFVGIFALLAALFIQGRPELNLLFDVNSKVFYGIFFLGIFSSMIAFSIQIVSQKKIPVHIAGFIFLLESPFAALFGYFILGEILSSQNIFGAVLISISVFLVPILGREVTTEVKSPLKN
jgi:drug/metabolite transporter (DMT)-like permease